MSVEPLAPPPPPLYRPTFLFHLYFIDFIHMHTRARARAILFALALSLVIFPISSSPSSSVPFDLLVRISAVFRAIQLLCQLLVTF